MYIPVFIFIFSGMEVLTEAMQSHVADWLGTLLETTDTVMITRRQYVDFLRTDTQQLGDGHGRFSRYCTDILHRCCTDIIVVLMTRHGTVDGQRRA
jgi:hypothetical protein